MDLVIVLRSSEQEDVLREGHQHSVP
jgi:hypothetical protein